METKNYSKNYESLTAFCKTKQIPSDKWILWIPETNIKTPAIYKRRTPTGVGSLTAHVFSNGSINIKNDKMQTIDFFEVIL